MKLLAMEKEQKMVLEVENVGEFPCEDYWLLLPSGEKKKSNYCTYYRVKHEKYGGVCVKFDNNHSVVATFVE